ncbi:hypothetical protein BU24DRAFT_423709 [Aaosphaeria arxii CBS 175.79]|uniref:BHLH domain-containing protein n=1 Tax=Aaosphaeria arxii CBS 175.79 TaxID=1450172 RepID=A0A6A5XPD2_9PLEO|nr:uncharacterized protein BU24DRAFT_423709 [Aaosphaeria arxii CBS 175.79]KAF2014803.1 hypothetical protein BU24DRAFT_423709 [Aaosphaeria arxii CBS 175.79]
MATMDESRSPNTVLDDGLALEKVAVGPYCIFDAFKPSPSPRSNNTIAASPLLRKKAIMNNLPLPGDFAFTNAERAPWLTTSGDDMALTAPAPEDFTRNDWNEWMQWDPNSSQHQQAQPQPQPQPQNQSQAQPQPRDAKPLNPQGPVCFLKPDQRTPLFNRRQIPQLPQTSVDMQSSAMSAPPLPATHLGTVPFSFGEGVVPPTAFDFAGTALSSPSTGDGQQQHGFYSPPLWDQQQQQGDRNLFSPQAFGHHGLASVPAPPLSTPSLQHSPSSVNNGRTSSSSAQSSPEPSIENTKKRKSSSEETEPEPSDKKEKQPPVKKTAHNMIEKRYRTNLNDKIAALRDSVPSLRVMSRPGGGNEEDDDPEDLEGLTPAHKLNKATVLSKATEYIRHLEKRNKRLQEEVGTLKGRLDSYEKMAISGPMALHGSVGTPDGSRYHDDPFAHHAAMQQAGPPQGMIPVPESMANLHRGLPPQPHYAPQAAAYQQYSNGPGRPTHAGPPMVNSRRSSAMMGKLMVGSLAGLMIMEGLVEREQSQEEPEGRGLFALPFNLAAVFAPRVSLGAASAQLPLAKLLLVFGAVFYIIAPLLDFRSKPKKKAPPAILLSRAPSLASPVEVRRKAWLTAIQTVWVPRHNFLLEVAALALKTLKLSTRKIIGWPAYAFLFGITKEQEAARVKAWLIALDAQLTGGDAEISKSRLVLTLMASGTLPDTPALLMLKALHIRVLLCELANTRVGGWKILEDLSAMLARRYWNLARTEHKVAKNASSKNSDVDQLPSHLAALLEMECDEVLIPSIVQRAYNLAWNKPSAENTTLDKSMDGVVEDFAISSPLDALAAWWSSHATRKALIGCLGSKGKTVKDSVKRELELAGRTAPPTSQARIRALAAQAVVLDDNRTDRIATAFAALPSTPEQAENKSVSVKFVNLISNDALPADVQNALTLAKCLALVECLNPQARPRAVLTVNNLSFPEATTTLLSFVAGYKVLRHFINNPSLQFESSAGLERLASSLRMWIGHATGRRSGLSNKIRARVIEQCLDASKTLVGLADPEDIDDGYVSSSVKDD